MKYPVYGKDELIDAIKEGYYSIVEFTSFLKQLEERNLVTNSTEQGIIAYIKTNGTNKLSTKQVNVLELIISRYSNKECRLCGEEISLIDSLDFTENNGFCVVHRTILDQD